MPTFKTSLNMTLNNPERVELPQLHYHILDYLTKRSRILSAHDLWTWNEFTSTYHEQYLDYTREELRNEFLVEILPRVFSYNLTNIQRRKVEIFAMHHHFIRTEAGFRATESRENNIPIEGEHFVRSEEHAESSKLSCVVHQPYSMPKQPRPDLKTNAWASCITSTDTELVRFCIYRGPCLRSRVTETRRNFHETGILPENMNPLIAKKITRFRNKAKQLSSAIFNDK